MLCFQALCQIICLFMYFYYFQKSRNVVFSGTVSDYLFMYFYYFQKSRNVVFRHCVRLFVYLCISIISRSPEMLCFQALRQIICLFMYFYYFQKFRNVMFSGTVSDYLFIYVFLLFPEVQKCYVFWHCALCKTGSSQWSVFETDITMSWINTNTVNKHFFPSSVTHRSTSRYILDQNVWQWIE